MRPAGGSRPELDSTAAQRIVLAAGSIRLRLVLAPTDTARRIFAALPLYGVAEPWGEAIHFEVPVRSGRDRTARLMARAGDVCYWPEEQRIIIAYGPTPISRPGEWRMPSPVNIIASAIDDVGLLQGVRVGEKISLLRDAVVSPE